jgi:MSHA pilin protein MshC
MELVTVLVILGVLSVAVIPRFWGSTFDQGKFFDDSITALRYAQRSALTMQRTVCVAFSASTITLTYDTTYGGATCPGTSLRRPDGATPYVVAAPSGLAFTATPTTFNFDRAGTPSVAQTIGLSGGYQIFIEAVTGHVHD